MKMTADGTCLPCAPGPDSMFTPLGSIEARTTGGTRLFTNVNLTREKRRWYEVDCVTGLISTGDAAVDQQINQLIAEIGKEPK